MKKEIQDLRVEMKQAKEIHLKEMSMLQQKYKMMQLEGNKETSTFKNQLKQEALNRKEKIQKEMYTVQSKLKEFTEEITAEPFSPHQKDKNDTAPKRINEINTSRFDRIAAF